jgi:hypothetical protein
MLLLILLSQGIIPMLALSSSSSNAWFPAEEMAALRDFHDGTGGETSWSWRQEGAGAGSRWNFSVSADSGEYVHNPCSGTGAAEGWVWQGITCSDSATACANHTWT